MRQPLCRPLDPKYNPLQSWISRGFRWSIIIQIWLSVLPLAVVAFVLAGCSSSQLKPAIKNYPLRAIDMPYAMPKTVNQYTFSGSFLHVKPNETNETNVIDESFNDTFHFTLLTLDFGVHDYFNISIDAP